MEEPDEEIDAVSTAIPLSQFFSSVTGFIEHTGDFCA